MDYLLAAVLIAVAMLAYANGSNDNFKGVATLFGSDTTSYKSALVWGTTATLAGSVCSIFLAQALLKNFSGKGLVPDAVVSSPEFVVALAAGAALTVLIATFTGLPISTTHAITGALIGSGFMASASGVNLGKLGGAFLLPLLFSPLLALALASLIYTVFHHARLRLGITSKSTVYVGKQPEMVPISAHSAVALTNQPGRPRIGIRVDQRSAPQYSGSIAGIGCQKIVDWVHFLAAGAVSFARGLNDTPKIVGLLFGLQIIGVRWSLAMVAVLMALGGLINARRVAETMSHKISRFNDGQGVTALLVTSVLVIFASLIALPVSTTHVSVGSITGIGLVNRTVNKGKISSIGLSWLLTLPIAAAISALIFFVITRL